MTPGTRRARWRVAAVLVVVCCLSGCRVITPQPAVPDPSGLGSGVSDFDALNEQGVARILETGEARFDLSTGTIPTSAVGLGPDQTPPGITAEPGEMIRLEVVGPTGTLHADTDHLRFFAGNDTDIDQITYFLTATDDEALFGMLRDGVDDYGIDGDSVQRWIEASSFVGAEGSDYAFPAGTRLGLEVIYDVRYKPSAGMHVIIVQVLGQTDPAE